MSYTENFSETHYPLIEVAPATYNAGIAVVSAYADMENYHRAVAVVHIGTVAQGGSVTVILNEATTAAGASAGALHTVVYTAAGVYAIEVQSELFTPGHKFIAVSYDVNAAAVTFSIILYGIITRYAPVPTTNWAGIHGP